MSKLFYFISDFFVIIFSLLLHRCLLDSQHEYLSNQKCRYINNGFVIKKIDRFKDTVYHTMALFSHSPFPPQLYSDQLYYEMKFLPK